MPHPLLADVGEMAGTAIVFGAIGFAAREPRHDAAFRLRRRRNFWRFLLGWGDLPEPTYRPGVGARVLDELAADGIVRIIRSEPALDVDFVTQEA